MQREELVQLAIEAMNHAYTPYSHYHVGAALLCKDGSVYQGCNIENASYGATNCAERTAFFKAVYDGKREFEAIAIVGGPEGELKNIAAPCGICRQVMNEFCNEKFTIYLFDGQNYVDTTLGELLPYGFHEKDME